MELLEPLDFGREDWRIHEYAERRGTADPGEAVTALALGGADAIADYARLFRSGL